MTVQIFFTVTVFKCQGKILSEPMVIFGDAKLIENQRERADKVYIIITLLHEIRDQSKKQIKKLENKLGRSFQMCYGKIEDVSK